MRTRTSAYQGVRDVSFSGNFACALSERSLKISRNPYPQRSSRLKNVLKEVKIGNFKET